MADLAWHFVGDTLRDGRPVPADGEWLRHDAPVALCVSGLHASTSLIDALHYAPGSTICRVAVEGIAFEESDKLVCRARVILWRLPAADSLLKAFARAAAQSVIHLWDAPAIVRQFLETGDDNIRDGAYVAACAYVDAVWAADAVWATAARASAAAARASAAAAGAAAAAAKRNELSGTMETRVCEAAGNPDDDALLKQLIGRAD